MESDGLRVMSDGLRIIGDELQATSQESLGTSKSTRAATRIVLLGPPASGKGTQAELIEKKYRLPATSTGAILRQEAHAGTERGIQAHDIISKGGLAPDPLILEVVGEWLDRSEGAFIFDGFPRTLHQAEAFDRLLEQRGWPLELVFYLEASFDTICERMSQRLTCRDCGKVVSKSKLHSIDTIKEGDRASVTEGDHLICPNCGGLLEKRLDDRHDVLERRMKEFEEKTLPVADFYRQKGILTTIDSNKEVDQVFQTISEVIEK